MCYAAHISRGTVLIHYMLPSCGISHRHTITMDSTLTTTDNTLKTKRAHQHPVGIVGNARLYKALQHCSYTGSSDRPRCFKLHVVVYLAPLYLQLLHCKDTEDPGVCEAPLSVFRQLLQIQQAEGTWCLCTHIPRLGLSLNGAK